MSIAQLDVGSSITCVYQDKDARGTSCSRQPEATPDYLSVPNYDQLQS